MNKWKLTTPVTVALVLIPALASAGAPRDIAFDNTRVFPRALVRAATAPFTLGAGRHRLSSASFRIFSLLLPSS